MSNVLPFHAAVQTAEVTLPVWSRPTDTFKHYHVTDDSLSYLMITPGSDIIGLVGAVWDRHPHAVRVEGHIYMGLVTLLPRRRVAFASWHGGAHTGTYRRSEIEIEAAICLVRCEGGATWVLRPPDRAYELPENIYVRPLLTAKA
jgi:hypothetical protein